MQRQKHKYKRPCERCEELFQPHSKYGYICEKCCSLNKRNMSIKKKWNVKNVIIKCRPM